MQGIARRALAAGRGTPRADRRLSESPLEAFGTGGARLGLEPHQREILGLGLVAGGMFLGGVQYFGWSGGAVGTAAVGAARVALGLTGYLLPVALISLGLLIVFGQLPEPGRRPRAGVVCVGAAGTLALAAGAFTTGPASTRDHWQASALRSHGGLAGQAEFWAASRLVSHAGAEILALFLFIAGLMLISRRTVAGAAGTVWVDLTALVRVASCSIDGPIGPRRRRRPRGAPVRRRLVGHRRGPAGTGVNHRPSMRTEEADRLAPLHRASSGVLASPVDTNVGPASLERRELSERHGFGEIAPHAPGARELADSSEGHESSIGREPWSEWRVPSRRLLSRSSAEAARPDTAGQEETAGTLLETLGHFGIEASLVDRVCGPHITRYELRLAPGTKVAKVAQLDDDLAYALAATDVRILAPIPGKQAVGVEVPNARRRIVQLGDVFQDPPPDWSPLTVWLGKDIPGHAIGADLAQMPHLLVAGTTGAGKSACLNAMLCSILLRATPAEVRFVLVDPKQVELNHYESIPHLLTPVITSPRMAANALQNLLTEMEDRYATMSLARTRSLPELNRARVQRGEAPLPYILCVIDELADLMMVAAAEVEDSIIRLAQKARAVGIHLLLATQSPRADVITGMIKANVPSRIAFSVSSQTDSRVILDQGGAEALLGQGDMLFSPLGAKVQRLQGAYIDERQIAALTRAWQAQDEPGLHEELLEAATGEELWTAGEPTVSRDEDPLLADAITLVAQVGTASTSLLQRRLRLGYTRAGRLIDMLERRGVISGYDGPKPRQVLIGEADVARILAEVGVTSGSGR